MNMSLLIVQPLIDAGKSMASAIGAKSQGGGSGQPFQALLDGKIAVRQPEKQTAPKSANSKNVAEKPASPQEGTPAPVVKASAGFQEGEAAEVAIAGQAQEENLIAEDVAILTQVMAVIAGAQIVPVEPMPGNDAAELADEAGRMMTAIGADTDKKMPMMTEAESVRGKEGLESGQEDLAYDKIQAAATQSTEPVAKKSVADTDMNTVAATAETTAARQPVAQQQAQQSQPQPQQATLMPAQQIQAAPVIAQTDPAAGRIMQQLGSPEWSQAVGQRVLWMVGQEQQSASLTLNPPELGPVRVVVSVSNNQASANFFSAHPDVRHALEGSLPRLREMLEGAGIQMGQAQVGAENAGNQQSERASHSGSRSVGATGGEGDGKGSVTVTEAPKRTISRGLIDTFA